MKALKDINGVIIPEVFKHIDYRLTKFPIFDWNVRKRDFDAPAEFSLLPTVVTCNYYAFKNKLQFEEFLTTNKDNTIIFVVYENTVVEAYIDYAEFHNILDAGEILFTVPANIRIRAAIIDSDGNQIDRTSEITVGKNIFGTP